MSLDGEVNTIENEAAFLASLDAVEEPSERSSGGNGNASDEIDAVPEVDGVGNAWSDEVPGVEEVDSFGFLDEGLGGPEDLEALLTQEEEKAGEVVNLAEGALTAAENVSANGDPDLSEETKELSRLREELDALVTDALADIGSGEMSATDTLLNEVLTISDAVESIADPDVEYPIVHADSAGAIQSETSPTGTTISEINPEHERDLGTVSAAIQESVHQYQEAQTVGDKQVEANQVLDNIVALSQIHIVPAGAEIGLEAAANLIAQDRLQNPDHTLEESVESAKVMVRQAIAARGRELTPKERWLSGSGVPIDSGIASESDGPMEIDSDESDQPYIEAEFTSVEAIEPADSAVISETPPQIDKEISALDEVDSIMPESSTATSQGAEQLGTSQETNEGVTVATLDGVEVPVGSNDERQQIFNIRALQEGDVGVESVERLDMHIEFVRDMLEREFPDDEAFNQATAEYMQHFEWMQSQEPMVIEGGLSDEQGNTFPTEVIDQYEGAIVDVDAVNQRMLGTARGQLMESLAFLEDMRWTETGETPAGMEGINIASIPESRRLNIESRRTEIAELPFEQELEAKDIILGWGRSAGRFK